jgi:hypothetical protein
LIFGLMPGSSYDVPAVLNQTHQRQIYNLESGDFLFRMEYSYTCCELCYRPFVPSRQLGIILSSALIASKHWARTACNKQSS